MFYNNFRMNKVLFSEFNDYDVDIEIFDKLTWGLLFEYANRLRQIKFFGKLCVLQLSSVTVKVPRLFAIAVLDYSWVLTKIHQTRSPLPFPGIIGGSELLSKNLEI